MENQAEQFFFERHKIKDCQIFLQRKNVIGIINLRPLTDGHVLLCTIRPVRRMFELNEEESCAFWLAIQEVSVMIEDIYKVFVSFCLHLQPVWKCYCNSGWS
eukprot:TRINITY_DN1806_c0_g2_i1.p1 TRINITY_DN1806_c0_g2~~TRINITY_DN1806_c0_g2_i1.p1  ORF type:complete len:102 (-),score=6.62 TRINITY_DN1806_c0_g2_i1:279-584(-)